MVKYMYCLTIFIIAYGCNNSINHKKSLLEADISFSAMSKQKGLNVAFIAFAHDSAVLLKPNRPPIVGIKNIKALYSQPDTAFQLTWKPSFAHVAKSGELGYTYGIYTLTLKNKQEKGTYVTIWKKTTDGWRYVLDSGNEGL